MENGNLSKKYLAFGLSIVLIGLLAGDAGADWRGFFRRSTPVPAVQVQSSQAIPVEKSTVGGVTGVADSDLGATSLSDISQSNASFVEKVGQAVVMCPTQYLYVVKQAKGSDSVLAANSLYKSDPDLLKTCSVIFDPTKASKLIAARNFACLYGPCHKDDADPEVAAMAAKIDSYLKCEEENIPQDNCPNAKNFGVIAATYFPGYGSFALFDTGLASLLPKEGYTLNTYNPEPKPGDELVLAKGVYIIGGLVKPFLPPWANPFP
jgi:hypothetical protein